MADYTLIGGITIQRIIDCIPIFDAMTEDFWVYANEYLPSDILFDDVYSVMFYFFKKEWIYMLVHSYYVNRAF